MKRTLITVGAVAALGLSACTVGQTTMTDGAAPRAVFPTTTDAPASGREAIADVVDRVLPAVVNVVSDFGGGQGEGTGFVVRSDGIVVTNYHVVEGASHVSVFSSDADPVRYDARVIGGDAQADLAILDIDASDLPTVSLGESSSLRLGQRVVAIGYALGLEGGPSVTTGIVSSLTRQITVPDQNCGTLCANGQRVYTDVVQTDAAINPGNSGGPLVDMAGQVVGINTAGANTAENIGFAIQIDAAKPTIFQAAENPSGPVAFMGIGSADASDPQVRFQTTVPVDEGAVILNIVPGGPADDAGLEVGDVVVDFGGQTITTAEGLGEAIRSHDPGDEIDFAVVHPDGSRETLTVTLGVNPVPTS